MYSNLVDLPRFYTALAEWMSIMVFCLIMPRKVDNLKFASIAAVGLAVQNALLISTESVHIYFWLPIMLLAVFFMYVLLSAVGMMTWKCNLYYTLKAFIAAEFVASFEWQISYYFSNIFGHSIVRQLILLVIVYGSLFSAIYYLEKKMQSKSFDVEITDKELVSVALIVVSVFLFSNLGFLTSRTPFSSGGTLDIFNVRTLFDFCGVAILYAYQSRIFELQAEKELMSIQSVLQSQYDTYRNYSGSIDLINMKYHDLKHQLEGLRGEMSQEKRAEWIDAIEDELQAYKPEQQTGNYTLDTLLSGKLDSCRKQKIKFTCVADGKLLSFMHVIDICNIFGNALDNAIENVALVEDEEKRLIHMRVFAQGTLLFISVTNYCTHDIETKHGYPVTTKADKKNHGFGIKSIDYAVKKYNGSISFGIENDMFELKILIPMK